MPETRRAPESRGSDSPLLNRVVFVVGARRSGTNWLERVLLAQRFAGDNLARMREEQPQHLCGLRLKPDGQTFTPKPAGGGIEIENAEANARGFGHAIRIVARG